MTDIVSVIKQVATRGQQRAEFFSHTGNQSGSIWFDRKQVFLTSFNQVFTFVLVQSGTSKPAKSRKDGEKAMDATSQADGATLSEERWVWFCWISWILQILLKSKQTNLSSSSARLKEFKSSLFAVFQSAHAQSVKMKTLMDDINKGREQHFSEAEVRDALAHMQDHNQVMVSDDIIFLIWAQTAKRNRMDSFLPYLRALLFTYMSCCNQKQHRRNIHSVVTWQSEKLNLLSFFF